MSELFEYDPRIIKFEKAVTDFVTGPIAGTVNEENFRRYVAAKRALQDAIAAALHEGEK